MNEWLHIIWHPDPATRKVRIRLLTMMSGVALVIALGLFLGGKFLLSALNPGPPACRASVTYGSYGVTSYQGKTLINFKGAGGDYHCANFGGAVLIGANFDGAVLTRVNLRGADLRNSSLRGADLRDADLTGANLEGADLSQANLRGAKGVGH